MNWFLFFLGALVVYRITRFQIEDSMFEVTRARFLMWLAGPPPQGVFSLPVGEQLPEPPKPPRAHKLRRKLADLITCPYCISFWFAVAWTIIQDWRYDVTLPLLYPFALAAGSLAAWRYIEHN